MAAQQAMQTAQQMLAQATTLGQQIASNVVQTVDQMDLPKHLAPLVPLVDAAKVQGSLLLDQASAAIFPLLNPYLGDAKQHLDKISQAEFALIAGGIFGGVFVLQLLLALTATCRRRARPLRAFSPTVFWLCFCVVIHSWIEMCFVWLRTGNASGIENGLNLYGAADLRYGFGDNLTLEPGTASMEAITALVVGPLCALLAWGVVGAKSWRWGLQVVVCTAQLYGLTWFATHPFFSLEPCYSEDPFLYWVFFFGFNVVWAIFPSILLIQALWKIGTLVAAAEKQQAQVQPAKAGQTVGAARSASKPKQK